MNVLSLMSLWAKVPEELKPVLVGLFQRFGSGKNVADFGQKMLAFLSDSAEKYHMPLDEFVNSGKVLDVFLEKAASGEVIERQLVRQTASRDCPHCGEAIFTVVEHFIPKLKV